MSENNEINEELYKNHDNRPDLAGEHPIGDPLQLLFLIIFIGAIAIDYFFFKTYSLLSAIIPFVIRVPIGLGLLGFGGWLALRGIRIVFKDLRPEPIMITEGMFSKVRHPIYLGAMIVYVGVLIIIPSLLGAIVFIFVMILYNWLAKHEENLMKGIFGDTYQKYIHQVPMWLPKLF